MDSYVVKIAEGAAELYVPKVGCPILSGHLSLTKREDEDAGR